TTNDKRLQDLKDDVCRILVCTEAAGMGLDIPDVEVVIQFRVGPNLTAADLWQRFGRCARDGRPGLCILFVDDVATLILDPDDCVINGFDYSTPLTAETRAKVIDMLKRMYEEDNRTNGGPRKDPAIIWIINTTGCRKRLFYAIFKDPSAMDFSPASEFMCNCDNCMFPEKQAYDRLIPPKELCEYVSAGKRGERIAAKIAASVEHVHVIEKRREAAATQAIMGQQVVHGFELSKTLRFYDSAAKEQEQVQEELAKMAEKKTQNVKILADRIRMELVAEWASICERDDLEEEIGLLPCFSFPLDMVNRISLDRRSLEFAILDTDADKCLNAILGDSVELNATHIAPYAKELQAAVLRAKVHYESILATREALAMAQSRANSVARSAAGTPAPSRAASVDLGQQATQMDTLTPADTLNAPPRLQMPPDDKNYCPFCISKNHPNGYTPKKIIDLLSHFATPTHLKRVAATVNGGTGDPRFRYYQGYLDNWTELIAEYITRKDNNTLHSGSWVPEDQIPTVAPVIRKAAPKRRAATPRRSVTPMDAPQPPVVPPRNQSTSDHTTMALGRPVTQQPPQLPQIPSTQGLFGYLNFSQASQPQGYQYPAEFVAQPPPWAHPGHPPPLGPTPNSASSTQSQPPTPQSSQTRQKRRTVPSIPTRDDAPVSTRTRKRARIDTIEADADGIPPPPPPPPKPTAKLATERENDEYTARETVLKRNIATRTRKQGRTAAARAKKAKQKEMEALANRLPAAADGPTMELPPINDGSTTNTVNATGTAVADGTVG
ncbi:hypothetical protein BJ508DRAFT_315520, partial [Ascobolus immersus RN42]